MTSRSPPGKDESIVIVGAGVFGLSLALELKQRGYQDVTVLDRYLPPVPDGSSVDISRVIRVDYADQVYGKMAREAHEGWTTDYQDHYHHSGFVMLCNQEGNKYIEKALEVSEALGQPLVEHKDATQIVKRFPSVPSNLEGLKAVINERGGWADAAGGINQLARQCSQAGVNFITGPRGTVHSLRYEGKRVVGVNVAKGQPILVSQVVLCTGAWSNRLLPVSHASTASGQPVGFIQLTQEEAESIRDIPVMINLSTGLFVFPPTPHTNILKVVRHGYGFATQVPVDKNGQDAARTVSAPKRDQDNASSGYLPEDADQALRDGLEQLLPKFAKHPWMNRRLCWYSDTPDGDFVVDHHPHIEGLFLAFGGAGHAYKMLPVVGRYTADCFENTAPSDIRHKWRLREPEGDGDMKGEKYGDGSRGGPPLRVLALDEQAKL